MDATLRKEGYHYLVGGRTFIGARPPGIWMRMRAQALTPGDTAKPQAPDGARPAVRMAQGAT